MKSINVRKIYKIPPLAIMFCLLLCLFVSSSTCEGPGLVCGHGPEVTQVALVANQHDDDVVVGMVPQLFQPALHILIGQVFGYVIH